MLNLIFEDEDNFTFLLFFLRNYLFSIRFVWPKDRQIDNNRKNIND
jgi:hypothetical protein